MIADGWEGMGGCQGDKNRTFDCAADENVILWAGCSAVKSKTGDVGKGTLVQRRAVKPANAGLSGDEGKSKEKGGSGGGNHIDPPRTIGLQSAKEDLKKKRGEEIERWHR